MGFKINGSAFLPSFFLFFYFLNANCWRAWLRRLAKILADKDCCQRLLPNLHPEIRNMHLAQTSNNFTFKSYRKIRLGNKLFFRTKNYNTQFIYTIYRGIPNLRPVLHAINDQNVILLRASANSLLRSSKVHILLVYKQEVWPPYSAHSSDWDHLSPQQQHIAFFSKNRNPIQFHFPFL